MEISYFWGGNSVGDAATLAPYDADEFSEFFEFLLMYDREEEGVIPTYNTSYDDHLEVTNPSGLTIRATPGIALVDGVLYKNTANEEEDIPSDTTWTLVKLKKDWAAQTVRIVFVENFGSEANALASLTQTEGTVWEIPLATVQGDGAGGVNVINDQRQYVMRPLKKKILVRPMGGSAGDGGVELPDSVDTTTRGVWFVPQSFHSGLTITGIFRGDGSTDNIRYENMASFAACDEYMDNNPPNQTSGETVYTLDAGQAADLGYVNCVGEISLSPEQNDFIYLEFTRHGTDVTDTATEHIYFWGWLIEYKARF